MVKKSFPWHEDIYNFVPGWSIVDKDIQFLKDLNVNVVRLGVHWAGVEPIRGEYNQTYLDITYGIIKKLQDNGIYTLVDQHQDVWAAQLCGHGAPLWFVKSHWVEPGHRMPAPQKAPFVNLDANGVPTNEECGTIGENWALSYLDYAVGNAFGRLYNNYDGLGDAWAAYWKVVATEYGRLPGVMGYDLMNEPWVGDHWANPLLLIPGVADHTTMEPLWNKGNDAIRTVDDTTIVMFEGSTYDILAGFNNVPGGDGSKTAHSYHYYKPPQLISIETTIKNRIKDATRLKTTGMLTEFELWGSSDDAIANALETTRQADRYLQSWAAWAYENVINGDTSAPYPHLALIYARTYAEATAGITKSSYFEDVTGKYWVSWIANTRITAPSLVRISPKLYYPDGIRVISNPPNAVTYTMENENVVQLHYNARTPNGQTITASIQPLYPTEQSDHPIQLWSKLESGSSKIWNVVLNSCIPGKISQQWNTTSTGNIVNAETGYYSIIQDHAELHDYYNKIMSSDDEDTITRNQNLFVWELARHSIGEELVVYPLFEKLLGQEGKDMAEKDRQEHLKVKKQLHTFQSMKAKDPEFKSTLQALYKDLKEHIEEEERDDLPTLEKQLSSDLSESYAKSFERTKNFTPTRSHPSAPDKPPFETVVGLMTAPMDKLADLSSTTAAKISGVIAMHQRKDDRPYFTTNDGIPWPDASHSLNVGGIPVISDVYLMQKQQTFNRSKTLERMVHPCGSGAFGYFECTKSVSDLTKAQFLRKECQKTPVFVRFSTVTFGKEFPDQGRNPRGFAIKFYTGEGNYDIVELNWPVFFCRDPIQGPDVIRSQQRNPANFLLDFNSLFDFLANVPENNHAGMMFFSDHGTPVGWRFSHGVNADGKFVYIKYHFRADHGQKQFMWSEAVKVSGEDPDYSKRDLWDAIESGTPVTWTAFYQIMQPEEADAAILGFDPFDVTKVWPRKQFPYNRLGVNLHQVPVNCPFMATSYASINFDGALRVDANTAGNPHYVPNSYVNKFSPDKAECPAAVSDNVLSRQSHHFHEGSPSEYDQVRSLYFRVMSSDARARLHANTADYLKWTKSDVRRAYLKQCWAISPDYARGIYNALPEKKIQLEEIEISVEEAARTGKCAKFMPKSDQQRLVGKPI
ncbi:hypothetical protein Dda_8956 [Drechslerella dactyloides]|uniref:Catalase core domain-containing protein n=1 Tax=Drechslerella dactyloides TaxID=74499 RepID=A0AAD6IRX4_DREDA|nr:hypothetical protein Dda_8956 [Drechslerella dactyloides]